MSLTYMRQPLIHKLAAILCLLVFSLHAWAGAHVVRCTDPSGKSHLEWGGCEQDARGQCASSCDDNEPTCDDSHAPRPCEDTPVQKDLGVATVRSLIQITSFDLPTPMYVLVPFLVDVPAIATRTRWSDYRLAAPPPAMICLKTVVLVV